MKRPTLRALREKLVALLPSDAGAARASLQHRVARGIRDVVARYDGALRLPRLRVWISEDLLRVDGSREGELGDIAAYATKYATDAARERRLPLAGHVDVRCLRTMPHLVSVQPILAAPVLHTQVLPERIMSHEEPAPADASAAVFMLVAQPEAEALTIRSGQIFGRVGSVESVVVPGSRVSARHATVVVDGGRVFVTDLSSLNGTYVNGTRIEANVATTLNAGARLRLADVELILVEVRR